MRTKLIFLLFTIAVLPLAADVKREDYMGVEMITVSPWGTPWPGTTLMVACKADVEAGEMRPKNVGFQFIHEGSGYPDAAHVTYKFDDKTGDAGTVKKNSLVTKDGLIETFYFQVPWDEFVMMIKAKIVEINLGEKSLELSRDNIGELGTVADRFP